VREKEPEILREKENEREQRERERKKKRERGRERERECLQDLIAYKTKYLSGVRMQLLS